MCQLDRDVDTFNTTAEGIEMEDIDDDDDVTFLIPHSDASALTAMVF